MAPSILIHPGAALDPTLGLSRNEALGHISRLMDVLGLAFSEVEIRFVDDREMARLNAKYLGLDGPTNVLSFPGGDPDRPDYLGQIALCADALRREATLYGQEPAEHLTRLLTHGLLHLAGYEHGPLMEQLTDAAVEALG